MRLLHDLHQTKPRRGDRPRVRPVKTLVAANATTAVAAAAPKKQKKKKESHHEEGTTAVAIAAAPRPTWDGDVYGLEWLDQGGSALIFAVDDARVAKVPLGSTGSRLAFEREREVYRRLNRRRLASGGRACEFVLRCWETEISTGLVLERCAQSVRQYLRERRRPPVLDVGLGGGVGEGVRVGGALLGPPVPAVGEEDVQRAVRWSYEVSHGLEFLHQAGIIHSDRQFNLPCSPTLSPALALVFSAAPAEHKRGRRALGIHAILTLPTIAQSAAKTSCSASRAA